MGRPVGRYYLRADGPDYATVGFKSGNGLHFKVEPEHIIPY